MLFHLVGPGIENFQIIGDAIPGGKLLGCGYPVRGTSLCVFQVKLLEHSSLVNFHLLSSLHVLRVPSLYIIVVCISVGSSSSGWN